MESPSNPGRIIPPDICSPCLLTFLADKAPRPLTLDSKHADLIGSRLGVDELSGLGLISQDYHENILLHPGSAHRTGVRDDPLVRRVEFDPLINSYVVIRAREQLADWRKSNRPERLDKPSPAFECEVPGRRTCAWAKVYNCHCGRRDAQCTIGGDVRHDAGRS
jgi:hypothetical protein